jgi:Flp pilus assembly protein TadD
MGDMQPLGLDRRPPPSTLLLELADGHLRAHRALEALRCADEALTADGASAEGWFLFARALAAIGERAHAIGALERAVAFDPALAAAHAWLGRLHDESDRPQLAERCWLRAVDFDPADAASLVNLSSLYCRADQFELGGEYARRALALDPTLIGAHQNLAGIFAKTGREADARRHRDLAYGGRNLLVVGNPRPVRRVLTLASAAFGNTPDRHLLPSDRYQRLIWFIEYATRRQIEAPPPHDVVFNAIGDPDSTGPTAANVELFLRAGARRVLNSPRRVARTSRHLARELFAGIDGVDIPGCLRVEADGATSADLARVEGDGPWLVRSIGAHGGEGLKLAAHREDLAAARSAYITSFREFRSGDGLYRKYRVFFVDRRPYPYHLAIGPHWLVHYATSGTADHPERLAEERRFLADPEAALGGKAMAALRAIGERMDLDFAGVDFSLTPDGRVLLFEANATMCVHPEPPGGPLAHKNPHVEAILAAFRALVEGG